MIPNEIFELLKYTLPALIVFLTAYFLLTRYMEKEAEAKAIEMKLKRDKEITMLRLQAFERLALFLERISPPSVIARVRNPDMICTELQYAMVKSIREEYEHNLSQQVYISSATWKMITAAKDEIIKNINITGQQLPPDASSGQLINAIFTGIAASETPLPTDSALEVLKAECRELF